MGIDNPHIVYVKTNGSGYITAVNSSAFLHDATGWTAIDHGYGDKYHHAQGNYFDKPIMTMGGAYRYKLVDGAVAECTAEEIAEQEEANKPEPTPAPAPAGDAVTWDDLDAAYQAGYAEGYTEGVNGAYDQ